MSPSLEELLAYSKARLAEMSLEEREVMFKKQSEGYAKAEASWPKPKFITTQDGTRIYSSYEDYCNG